MCKRIVTLGLVVLTGFLIFGVYEPQCVSVVSASSATVAGTIAYVVPNNTTGDQVWLVDANGSNPRRIYSTGVADPYSIQSINGLAWRPDGGELVFASNHEEICSWYGSDLYAITATGSGYRRVTNAPACAGLANYPKGTVTVSAPGANALYQLYVMGAPSAQTVSGGAVTFYDVADLGSIVQPVVAIDGSDRWMGDPVDVKAGQAVNAGAINIYVYGSDEIGAFEPTWRRDGSRIGYAFGCARLYGIADQPPAGNIGQPLFNASGVAPCVMAWGSTASTANQIVYFTPAGDPGIYLTTEGSTGAGTKLISTADYDHVFGMQFLPDASGFIFTMTDNWSSSSNLYHYDIASDTLTKLTFYTNEFARDFSLSPDGQTIVYERAPEAWGVPYGGASDLWTIGIDGFDEQLFKANGAHPSWSTNSNTPPPPPPPPPGSGGRFYLPFVNR